jgi:mRNA interferase MazF
MSAAKGTPLNPRRGEVWWVDFNPHQGSEMNKVRPAVVLSVNGIGKLPVRVVVPITGWDDRYLSQTWQVRIPATPANGLDKDSAVDALHVRSVALQRFRNQIGRLTEEQVSEVASAAAIVLGIQ